MKIKEADKLGKDFFVSETGDEGFRDDEVYRMIQRVVARKKPVKGMKKVFKARLTAEGESYVLQFCNEWCSCGGLWGYMNNVAITNGLYR